VPPTSCALNTSLCTHENKIDWILALHGQRATMECKAGKEIRMQWREKKDVKRYRIDFLGNILSEYEGPITV
jgi:hypothetical protein